MNRIRRTALVTGSALATLVLTLTAMFWPGRDSHANAQYARRSAQGQTARPASSDSSKPGTGSTLVADAGDPAGSAANSAASASSPSMPAIPAGIPDTDQPSDVGQVPPPQEAGKAPILHIKGEYDIKELRRLIRLAKDSGFTDSQLRQITVEDEHGHVVNALDFLEAYERHKKEEAARLAAEKAKVYLTPKDILKELDDKQPKDLDKLRDKMVFVE